MIKFLIVGAGGAVGSMLRYFTGLLVNRLSDNHPFPFGTLAVNLIGCFLIGFFISNLEQRDLLTENVKLFVIIGLLGGFTTFSTFGFDAMQLFKQYNYLSFSIYVIAHITLCLTAVWVGMHLRT